MLKQIRVTLRASLSSKMEIPVEPVSRIRLFLIDRRPPAGFREIYGGHEASRPCADYLDLFIHL